MTAEELAKWMADMNFNKSKAADELEISRVTLNRYLSGKARIPRTIQLACIALLNGLS